MTHPKYEAKKLYHVVLNKQVKPEDIEKIKEGVLLDDGFVKCDQINFVEKAGSGHEVGIELHSGKNRIVRRIFEHLGYIVEKLDRVSFAGLTKKELPRSFYRHLTEKEVAFLKMNR